MAAASDSQRLLLNQEIRLHSFLRSIESLVSNNAYESLIKTYENSLKYYQNINQLCIYTFSKNSWVLFFQHNTKNNFSNIAFPKKYQFNAIKHSFASEDAFEEFHTIIPLRYKTIIRGYLLIGWKNTKLETWVQEMRLIKSLTNIVIITQENKKNEILEKKRKELHSQLELAQSIQKRLFSPQLPYTKRLKLHSSYIPHYAIGGDCYAYKKLSEDKIFLCIGDVSYKGISAALIVSNFQAALEVILSQTQNLSKIVNAVNQFVIGYDDVVYSISACFFIYDFSKKRLKAINCGHPYPILADLKNNQLWKVKKGTTLIGFNDSFMKVEQEIFDNLENFLLFSFTDGLIEFNIDDDECFDEDDLENWLANHINLDLKDIHSQLLEHIKKLNNDSTYDDDITLFSCRINN